MWGALRSPLQLSCGESYVTLRHHIGRLVLGDRGTGHVMWQRMRAYCSPAPSDMSGDIQMAQPLC